jgi:hypothetical protein
MIKSVKIEIPIPDKYVEYDYPICSENCPFHQVKFDMNYTLSVRQDRCILKLAKGTKVKGIYLTPGQKCKPGNYTLTLENKGEE